MTKTQQKRQSSTQARKQPQKLVKTKAFFTPFTPFNPFIFPGFEFEFERRPFEFEFEFDPFFRRRFF